MTRATSTTQAEREEQQLAAQLTGARSRLIQDLGDQGHDAEEINRTFDSAAAGFDDARVRSFVPILVERVVRSRLGNEGAVIADVNG